MPILRSLRYGLCTSLATLLLLTTAVPARAATSQAPQPLKLEAGSAVLLEYETGKVLYELNPDAPHSPASLTKLMTLHLAYKRISEGAMKPGDPVEVREEAWAAKWPGSSVMFLEPGQNVTVQEIMKGIAIPSGNDAAVALAQHMSGSVSGFVALMNKEAEALGYKKMHFAEPAGLSPENQITAREFADFCRLYVRQHPQALTELHSVKEFAYPLWENLNERSKQSKSQATYEPIVQPNRNGLLDSFQGVDGLKTGFIEEAGYNIALTAKRGEMRLVAVILGVQGRTPAEGTERREEAGAALLNWGFSNFSTVQPPVGEIPPVKVWKGAANEIALEPQSTPFLVVARGQENRLTRSLHQESSVVAPVKKGDRLGELIWAADGEEIARVPLVAATDVQQGGFFKRLWDTVRMTISAWLTRKK